MHTLSVCVVALTMAFVVLLGDKGVATSRAESYHDLPDKLKELIMQEYEHQESQVEKQQSNLDDGINWGSLKKLIMRKQEEPLVEEQRPPPAHVPNNVEAEWNNNEDLIVEDEEEPYHPDEGWNDLLMAYLQDFMDADAMSGTNQNSDCISGFTVSAQTGTLRYAGYSSSYMYGRKHYVKLFLRDGRTFQGNLPGTVYNGEYVHERLTDFDSTFSGQCIRPGDIVEVKLVAGGGDSWYVESITTIVELRDRSTKILTQDNPFNKWLDSDEPNLYPGYDATQQQLNIVFVDESTDVPHCGYGVPVCQCKETAKTCVFNLEVDEIMTFTSYRKVHVGLTEGLAVRATQGVIYNFDKTTGKAGPHPAYSSRHCANPSNKKDCTDPQFVDGKTYRMAIGVNGQIPGPTIIVHEGQNVVLHVHNNMTIEGISIHWHGMHQIGTPWMDGVGQVTQCQIGPSSSYTYDYIAKPSGTFWYHSHSGAQRTDGFFGALIVKERGPRIATVKYELARYHVGDFEDLPDQHSISLLDWQHETSLDTFSQLHAGLGFYPEIPVGEVPEDENERYESTRSIERGEVGPFPYFSGLINGKGRHEDVPCSKTRLSVFTVTKGKSYRFRLIGAQGLYAYKFSIDGHRLTVVGTDGYWTKPQKNIDYIIIHTGERYDFILDANQPTKNYWMRAETLEINQKGSGPPYKSLGHVAEGILQYVEPGQAPTEIPSTQYEAIKTNSPPIQCYSSRQCYAVNCPFREFHRLYYTTCINVHQLQLLEETPLNEMPEARPPSNCPDCQHFINFNFEGDSETSSVNGRNFILPPAPPQTQNEDFKKQANICDLNTYCNPSSLACTCTQIIDIPHDKTVQFVLTALGAYDNAHPIHLHGHTFHVVDVGYPDYDLTNTGFIAKKPAQECGVNINGGISVHNSRIQCDDTCKCPITDGCKTTRCTKPRWRNNQSPPLSINRRTIRKDTVMVPAGGYVVINFKSDNPGHWFLHCHIEVHQLEGMALIVNEAPEEQKKLDMPDNLNKCGDYVKP